MSEPLFDPDADPDADAHRDGAAAGDDARRSRRRGPGVASARNRRAGRSSFGDGQRHSAARGRTAGSPAGESDDLTPADPAGDEHGDPEAVARGICLRALTGAAKTRQQLADLLTRKDVPVDAAEAVLDRLTEVGLIDDAAFAAAWVSSRQSGRGLARRALVAELRAKGVDGDVAAEAVAVVDVEDEREAAQRLVERKLTAMSRLDRTTAERRLIGMLARKGYAGGLAAGVVRAALDGAAAENTDPDDELSAAPPTGWSRRARPAAGHPIGAGGDDASDGEVGEGRARALGRRFGPAPDSGR